MRFYFRHLDADVNDMSTPNRLTWHACDDLFKDYSANDFAVMCSIYQSTDGPMQKVVARTALEHGISSIRIWIMLNKATRDFARKRGLIE